MPNRINFFLLPVVSYCRLDHIFFIHHLLLTTITTTPPKKNKRTNKQPCSWAQQVGALAMKPEDVTTQRPTREKTPGVVLWPPLVCVALTTTITLTELI